MRKLLKSFLLLFLLFSSSNLNLFSQTIISSQSTICQGDSVTLELSDNLIGTWSNLQVGNSIRVAPSVTTIYSVSFVDSESDSITSLSYTVTVNQKPDATISGVLSVCPGSSTTLTAPIAQSYLWSNGAVTPSIQVSPMQTTDYWVRVTSTAGCVSYDTVRVQVNMLPNAQITGATSVCPGSGLYLSATEGYSYFWSTGDTTSTIYVTPTVTTSYSVRVTNASGCSQTISHLVTVNSVAQTSIVGPTAPICAGSNAVLSATGGVNYSWSHGLGNSPVVTVAPLVTTTYFVNIVDEHGCSQDLSYTVNVSELTAPSISGSLSICKGDSTILTASSATSYLWSNDQLGTFATTPSVVLKPTETTDYSLTVFNEAGCYVTRLVRVSVNEIPADLSITGPQSICAGNRVVLSVPGTGYFYQWSTGETTSSITVAPSSATTYTCLVTTLEGCSALLSKTISIQPTAQVSITGDSIVCSGDLITLTATGGTSYRWNTGDTTATITAQVNATTIFSVSADNGFGCWSLANHVVQIIPRPLPTITGATGVCSGSSVRLTATGGTSFRWSTGETTSSITVTPQQTTTYQVWSSYNGCESLNPAEHTVEVKEAIDARISGALLTCQGDSVVLTASGASRFLWSNGATTASVVVRPVVTTTYTCKVYEEEGCEATVQHTVQVDSIPHLSVTGNLTICQGEQTTLTASGAPYFSWTGGVTAQGASITVAPMVTTTYVVTAIGANGCSTSQAVTVIVNDFADASIIGYKNICPGGTTTLTVTGNDIVSYLWDNGNTTPTIQVSPTQTTTYTVVITNQKGCQKALSTTVSVGDAPIPIITGPSEMCENEVIQLTVSLPDGSDAQQYMWSNGQYGKTITVSPGSSTTYNVTAVLPGGCTSTASHSLTVHPMTYAMINGSTTTCAGSPVVLTASGGTTYTWNNGMTGAMITVFPDVTTLYEVTVTNNYGCVSKANHLVTIDPLPSIVVTGDTVVCEGSSTQLVAVGGVNYLWNNGSISNSILVTPAVTTTYQVVVSAASGCDTTLYFTVKVNPQPSGNITGNFMICEGESTTLTATGGVSYAWSNGAAGPSITESPTSTTSYSVTITDEKGCTQTIIRSVVVNQLPIPSISGKNDICVGESTTLTASGAGIGGYYIWSTGEQTTSIQVSPVTTTTYSVIAVSRFGCQSKPIYLTVNVHQPPKVSIAGNRIICPGSSTLLTAQGDALTYRWSTGDTTPSIMVSTPGTYVLQGFSAYGCSEQSLITVVLDDLSDAVIMASETYICGGEVVTLTASGGDSYIWNTGAHTASIQVNPSVTTTYSVVVYSSLGCQRTLTQTIYVNQLQISGKTSICRGESTALTAFGLGSSYYVWNTGDSAQTITVTPDQTTTYSVNAYSPRGCDVYGTVTVDVYDFPKNLFITGTDTICAGEVIALTANGGTFGTLHEWSTGETASTILVAPTYTQDYWCRYTAGAGCDTIVTYKVVVLPTPSARITAASSICAGDSIILMASGGTHFQWNVGNSTEQFITVAPTTNTTYQLIAFNESGCSDTVYHTVTINQLPNVIIMGANTACVGTPILLVASDGTTTSTYTWNNGMVGDSIWVTLYQDEILVATCTTIDGCKQETEHRVKVYNYPVPSISGTSDICYGSSTTLTAAGGNSYLWSTGSRSNTLTVSPQVTTTYWVDVTALGGCTVRDSITINVHPLPLPEVYVNGDSNAVTSVTICQGESLLLTGDGAGVNGTYSWTNADASFTSTSRTITIKPTLSTFYYLTVTNESGCSNILTFNITVQAPIIGTITGINTICEGESITLTATSNIAGTQYLWNTGETTASIHVTPAQSQDYWCRFSAAPACDTLITYPVVVNTLPVAQISGPTVSCAGDTVVLLASGGTRYLWNVNNKTDASITVTPKVTTTYQLVAYNAEGCSDTVYHTVNINRVPTVIVIGSSTACQGEAILLVASDGTTTSTYSWSNGMVGDSVWVTLHETETLTVTCTTSDGCVGYLNYKVTVYDFPIPSITGNTETCYNTATTLTASGGRTYLWSTGSRSNAIRVAPLVKTTYWVDITGLGNCTVRDSIVVDVLPRPTPLFYVNGDTVPLTSVTICRGESVRITGGGAGENGSYYWRNANSTFTSTSQTITVSPTVSMYYYLTDTRENGCFNTAYFRVNVQAPVIGSILGEDTICANTPTLLSLYGVPSNATLYWSTGETGRNITVAPSVTTTYNCEVTNIQGCDTIFYHTVHVLDAPNAAITAPDEICEGDVAVLIASGGDYYVWNNGITSDRIAVRPTYTTTYSVQISNMNGCSETLTHTVVVNPKPAVRIVGNTYCCTADSVMLYATDGTTTTRYLWENGLITDTIWVKPQDSIQTYKVIATSAAGCVDTAYHTLTVYSYDPISISGNTSICQGTGTTITINGGVSWRWSTGATMQTVYLNPNVSTTYWVDVTSRGGCTERVQVPITVMQLPQASIWVAGDLGASSLTTLCSGHQITLEGHGAGNNGTFLWMDALGNRLSTSETLTVRPTQTSTYYLEVMNENGCYHTAWFVVYVLPTPNMNLSASKTAICQGDVVTLTCGTTNSTLAYQWTDNQGLDFTGTSMVVMPQQTTTYYVQTTTSDGCLARDSITIQVFPQATASITGPAIVCPGDTVTLFASEGDSYQWSNGATTRSIVVCPYGAQYYSVEVVNAVGCNGFAEFNLQTYTPMNLLVTADDTIYVGETTTLTASGALNYYWNNGQNGSTITVAPLTSTSYSVTGVDENGCSSTVTVNIVVIQYKPTIIGDQTVCLGEETTITVDAGLNATYLWSTGATTQSITVAPTVTTQYTVSVVTQTGASGTETITITVLNPPVIVVDKSATVCQSDVVAYYNFVANAGNPDHYLINFDQAAQAAGFPANIANISLSGYVLEIPVPAGVAPGTYNLEVIMTGLDGCVGQPVALTLEVLTADMIVLKWNDVLICDNINHEFTTYQWYKNGNPIPGATLQYYSETGGFYGSYYVVATREDGTVKKSCPLDLQTTAVVQQMVAQPNPVKRFEILNLTLPYTPEQLDGAVVRIFDMTGRLIETHKDLTSDMKLNIPYTPGMYLLMVQLNNGTQSGLKFLVNE